MQLIFNHSLLGGGSTNPIGIETKGVIVVTSTTSSEIISSINDGAGMYYIMVMLGSQMFTGLLYFNGTTLTGSIVEECAASSNLKNNIVDVTGGKAFVRRCLVYKNISSGDPTAMFSMIGGGIATASS